MNKTLRLYPTIKPAHYDITLKPDLTTFTFEGEETLTFSLEEETKIITLHAVELTIKEASLLEGEKHLIPTVSYDEAEKTVSFTFPEPIAKGEKTLHLTFSGLINERLEGWYRSAYEVQGQTQFMATSHFEEIGARRVFPCVDEPAAKATFSVTLVIPKYLTAIFNTLSEQVTEEGELKRVVFAQTPVMSTYILVFIVGEFESIEKKADNGVLVRVFVTPGKKSLATFALNTASKMLPFYEKYFGVEYPLPKLDFIAIPDFDAGAMENWGGVTAREAALLVDEEKSATVYKQWVATVIAHETSHMWFGDLVTLEWWTYLWLNEGFASYMEYFAVDELFPEWHVWEQFAVLDHNRALGLDALKSTHPVETPVTDLARLPENFDEISYSKGASVIHMLASYMGKDIFQKGIQAYLKKHAYANATSEDLWTALEEASGKPIREIMHAFIQEPGTPILLVDAKDKALQLTQKRFFISSVIAQNEKTHQLWDIPFALSSSDTALEKEYLMQGENMTIPAVGQNTWVKINTDETSYVRAVYAAGLYDRLNAPIEQKRLSPIDRMGILRDAFDGAESGLLPLVFALKLAESYMHEDAYIVWATLSGKIGKVANLLANTDIAEKYDAYAKHLFQTIGERMGWESKPEDTHTDILLRSLALYGLGKYADSATVQKAQQLFKEYIEEGKPIGNDIRSVVYQLVARNGTEKEFIVFEEMYKKESLPEEKNRIGSALVSFQNPQLVKRALEFSISEHVRPQDITRFILLAFDNEKGKEMAWEFVKDNWEFLYHKHEGQIGMSRLIDGAGNFTSLQKKQDVEAFFADRNIPYLTRALSQVLEQIEANAAWLARDKDAIESFLSENYQGK